MGRGVSRPCHLSVHSVSSSCHHQQQGLPEAMFTPCIPHFLFVWGQECSRWSINAAPRRNPRRGGMPARALVPGGLSFHQQHGHYPHPLQQHAALFREQWAARLPVLTSPLCSRPGALSSGRRVGTTPLPTASCAVPAAHSAQAARSSPASWRWPPVPARSWACLPGAGFGTRPWTTGRALRALDCGILSLGVTRSRKTPGRCWEQLQGRAGAPCMVLRCKGREGGL